MVVTGMIGHDINNDFDVFLLESSHHRVKVLEGTDSRVNVSIVGNII
jgi:hypothetical protein